MDPDITYEESNNNL